MEVLVKVLKISLLVHLDGVEHVLGAAMEVLVKVLTRVGEEVNKCSLLHEVVLFVDSNVLDLLLGVDEVGGLDFFGDVSPLVAELGGLVSGVDVVEVSELWSEHEGEVTDFEETNVPSDQELVMVDETSDPLVVGPSSESGDGSDRSDVGEQEDKTTSASREGLVVRGNLLWANSLEESLHVSVVGEEDWVGFSMVWVLVPGADSGNFVGVVTLSVLGLVLSLGNCLWLASNLSPSLDIGFFEARSDGGCCSRHVSGLTLHEESVEERLRLLKSDHFLSF